MQDIDDYILCNIDSEPPHLAKIYREAHVKLLHPRMASGHLQGRLLKMFVQMIHPKHILEIGTYTGYSAICLAEGLEENGKVHTIEINDEMEDFIRNSFQESGYEDKIALHIGDAMDIIPSFEDDFFQLAFIDGDKRLYWNYFELTLPKIEKGGFLIVDNTLWNGKVVEAVESNDWQTKGVLEFNKKLANDNRVEKVILPVRDGLTLIRKK